MTSSFLVGTGLVAAVTYLLLLLTDVQLVEPSFASRYVELLLLGVPAVGLVTAGGWLRTAEFDADQVWRIGAASAAGTAVAAVATGLVLLVVTGLALDQWSTFALLIATGTEGGLLGVIVGTVAVTDRRYRRERATAAELETLHALLRHNLRNRLTILDGRLTLLTEELGSYDEDAVATIEAQLTGIEALLEDTRLAAQAVGGPGDRMPVDLAEVVRDQLALLEASYDRVSVTADLPERAPVLAGDLLATAVENVLTNAVVHHDSPTVAVDVAVAVAGDRVRLRIADDGPGIPPARRDAVFAAGTGEGTGMGLYLANTVVERTGGTLELDDNEPRGTVVTVTLPRAGR